MTEPKGRITKEQAEYSMATGSRRCGNCSMFRLPGRCTLVKGIISQDDTCKYWESHKEPMQKAILIVRKAA